MLSALVVFGVLIYVLTGDIRRKKTEERLKRTLETETVTIIEYDRRIVKVFGIMTVVSVISFAAVIVIAEYVEPAAGLFVLLAGFMILLCGVNWVIGACYLMRLKKYGYVIPERRKDYDYILERVPRAGEITEAMPYNRRCRIFAVIYGWIWLVMLATNIWFYYVWNFMEGVEFLLGLLLIADLYWLIRVYSFHKQMSNEKYKEDVEIDKNRKKRITLEHAIIELLIMLLLSFVIKETVHNYVDYVYRSQVDADHNTIMMIGDCMMVAYDELMMQEQEASDESGGDWTSQNSLAREWEGSRQQLMEGVDITTWGVPQDIYQQKVADFLGISDFTEMKDDFRSVKGDVVVYVKMEDGKIRVNVPNIGREVGKLLIITSEGE